MDRPAVHRSSLPQSSWSQPYPNPAPPNLTYSRPLAPQFPPHDQHDPYPAPTLYPTAVSQHMPAYRHNTQPLSNALASGGYHTRPRGKTTYSEHNNSYGFDQGAPPFPSPAPPQFPQAHPFPHYPTSPTQPPALQPQLSGYPSFPPPNQLQDVVPIRPPPMSIRRPSSSPPVSRIPPPVAPPVPPLPPDYLSNNPQIQRRPSPQPPPTIPIPSNHSYPTEASPSYDSPYETSPLSSSSTQPRGPSPPRFPTSSLPEFERDVKRAPVDEEEEALALAIALSQKESMEHSGQASQEDEDLAKAIEESIRHATNFGISIPENEAGPSTLPKTSSPLSFPSQLPVYEPSVRPHTPLASPVTPHASASRPTSKMPSPLMRPVQPTIHGDEALALRLADEEDEAAAAGPSSSKPQSPVLPSPTPEITAPPVPGSSSSTSSRRRQESNQSRFAVVNSDSNLSPAARKHQEANQSKLAIIRDESEPPPPMYHHVIPAQTSASANISPTLPSENPALGRSTSTSAVPHSSTPLSSVHSLADKFHSGRSQSLGAISSGSSSVVPSPSALTNPSPLQTVEESYNSTAVQSPSSSSSAGPNSFVDQQLLYGVSLGFNVPQISSIKTTLKGGVPNVISLPMGKYVPFHIQAPNWRHLLKMMARLSGSRVEASIEALAANKQELKLRTIVQFVRVNPNSEDWRTVIYLTIDNPPPSNAPHKYTNGDVNTLPFSYAASPLPALLRDGPEAPMSKYYTIPSTSNTPYPTLPISFPNMAMYLASAVEDSRRLGGDNSSGMKRLSKTLDVLYPAQVELGMEDDEPDKPTGGMVGLFKNVFGRGGKKDQRRNDDNYADLVTPFVTDWG